MSREVSEQEIRRKVNEFVEQKLDQNLVSGSRDRIAQEIIRNLEKERQKKKILESRRINRRDFLKLLGLGAGTIGLASGTAGAWGQLRASSQGLSDIDADEVDGHHLSVGSSKPGSPATGTLFYDTDGEGVHYYNGSSWVQITSTAHTGAIDDFESGDLSGWTGDTADFSIITSPVAQGTYSLQGDSADTSYITSSGLTTPDQGDTFRWYTRSPNGNVASGGGAGWNRVSFAVQGSPGNSLPNNAYAVQWDWSDDTVHLEKISSGGVSELSSASNVGYAQDEWWECRVDWASDGTMTVRAIDPSGNTQATISGTDTDYAGGKMNIRSNKNVKKYWDYFRFV